ncbi:MAG TPA: LysE family translocator [Gammaproteobacteria bacterium]
MALESWFLYIPLAFFISATPGPVMMFALSNGAIYGTGKALSGIAGTSSGNMLLMLLSASGLGALLQTSEKLLPAIQWLGAAYLIYLGYRIAYTPATRHVAVGGSSKALQIFSRGFLVAASNPKGIVFFGALFPQFIEPDQSLPMQLMLLAFVFLLIDGLWQLLYATGGNTLSNWLRDPARTGLINKISGGMLAGSGILLAIETGATL